MAPRSISDLYGEATRSFIDFARTLNDEDWATPVPCTPGWTVRDVLSHVSGVPDDGLAGRVDGAATEPWTASQVERNAGFSVEELLERWEGQYEQFGVAVEGFGERRPPYDCHSHEHDVRHALGRPGNRATAVIVDASTQAIEMLSDVPASITVRFDDGTDVVAGVEGSDVAATLSTSRFEVFRSRLGRRTAEQVRALDWTGDAAAIDAVLDVWFLFGPSDVEIDE